MLSLNCSYLSVKLASSTGSSSKRSGRLCVRSSLGEDSSSSSCCFLLKTSCLSSSMDFLGYSGEAMVLARLLFDNAGDDGGSYRVNDWEDSGDGRGFAVLIVRILISDTVADSSNLWVFKRYRHGFWRKLTRSGGWTCAKRQQLCHCSNSEHDRTSCSICFIFSSSRGVTDHWALDSGC